jgi:hypothetical protein
VPHLTVATHFGATAITANARSSGLTPRTPQMAATPRHSTKW